MMITNFNVFKVGSEIGNWWVFVGWIVYNNFIIYEFSEKIGTWITNQNDL